MEIVVAGSHGLIGTALISALAPQHTIRRLVRREPVTPGEFHWDPEHGVLDRAALDGADAVINLAGVGIGDRRWTADYRRRIEQSRTATTGLIAEALRTMDDPPDTWLQASAIGFYGDRGTDVLTETDERGEGFLADVVGRWEAASAPAADRVRVVLARSGIVLSRRGGAVARLWPILRSGLAGRIGTGSQYWSWITLVDEIAAMTHLLTADVAGPVNLTAPHPASNADVITALAAAAHRPARLPVPAGALRAVLGGFAQDLLASTRAIPHVLSATGFAFTHPTLALAAPAAVKDASAT